MTSNRKRRRISVPLALDNVQPLSASGDEDAAGQQAAEAGFAYVPLESESAVEKFPDFLLNALVGEIETIDYDGSPFKQYIHLKESAWGDEAESEYLIVRECYKDLVRFLIDSFEKWKPGKRLHRTITGTAGIGKTMFALYLARLLFERRNFVLLYYGQQFWAFTKNAKATSDPYKKFLDKETEATDGTKIYYTFGTDAENVHMLHGMMARPDFITIRDCGKSDMTWLDLALGRIIYVSSSGQETFISLIEKKFGLPSSVLIKYSDLWSDLECAWSIKLGLLRLETQEQHTHGSGNNNSLDIEYVLEGYRRYGGSIRNVLAFARELKLANAQADTIMNYPIPTNLTNGIAIIVDLQASSQREKAKAKALVLHQSPVQGTRGHRVHFASTFVAALVMKATKNDKVKMLNTVVAALSVSGGNQSAYGALYEEEFHRIMMDMPFGETQPGTFHLLGSHEPSSKVTSMVPKHSPTLDFARTSVLHFPGKSLENASLKSTDDLRSVYFHPLTSNFPTHDSFIVCKASDFFEANSKSTKQDQQQMNSRLTNSIVLVGLQQTVSGGSDDVEDKPSHAVVGQHLVDHLRDFKNIVQQHRPDINILDDIVTVFVSPSENCRKMKLMPILNKDHKPLQNAIASFARTAVQYYTVMRLPLFGI